MPLRYRAMCFQTSHGLSVGDKITLAVLLHGGVDMNDTFTVIDRFFKIQVT